MIGTKRAVACLSLALAFIGACRSDPAPDAASPSPSLASADPKDAFVPLDGFRYRNVPAGVRQQMEDQLTADPQARHVLEGFDARFAVAGKDTAVLVFSMAVTPEAAANPFFTEGVFVGFEQGFGGRLTEEEIGGQPVRVGTPPQGGGAIVWQRGALIIGVFGDKEGAVRDVVTQVIEGMGSPA
jgi:hypothetical protein